jgi:hypothetical protein
MKILQFFRKQSLAALNKEHWITPSLFENQDARIARV